MASVPGSETLSMRAAAIVGGFDFWSMMSKVLANAWSPSNPDGIVVLGLAQNALMHNELQQHIASNLVVDPQRHFTYGNGPRGSPALREALSAFFNDYFHPVKATVPDEFVVTSGVAAANDGLTWSVCNEGEGILFPQPFYNGFNNDVQTRARAKVVPVPFAREDGSVVLDDLFDAKANVSCLERARQQSEQNGVKIKAVVITNPHNPTGKCYPVETIKAIVSFCAKHGLHYVSDEIYALSTFENTQYPEATKFTSALAIELDGIIPSEFVHVVYGAAKDFGVPGLRLGLLHSRNPAIRDAMGGLLAFAWCPNVIQDTWARLLSDKPFLKEFMSTNQARLGKNYHITTSFLDAHGISYLKGGNSTLFVWADFRKRLLPDAHASDFRITSPEVKIAIQRQDLLFDRCMQNGVMIGKGQGFSPEEIGWFRIVFASEESVLRMGLQRVVEALESLEKSGWT